MRNNFMPPPAIHLASYAELAARVATRLAEGRASAGALAPWAEDVIVASSGVGETIAARLLEQIPAGVAGLQLQPLDALARRIVNAAGEYPRVASEAERRLAMRTAVRSLDDPIFETRGAAAMLERTYRDVRDSGVTTEEFANRTRRAASLRNRDRNRLLLRAFHDYDRLIHLLGAIDPADLLGRAAALVRAGSAIKPQLLAGFYDMTGAQLGLIHALREVEKLPAVFIPVDPDEPEAYAYALPFLDCGGLVRPSALGPRPSETTVTEYRTREDEIRGACVEIASLLASGTPASEVGIVARGLEPYDAHLFERFARACGFAVSTPVAMPLTAHRIGRGVMLLLRLRERDFPRSDVLELVRSGLKTETRINADKADVETRRAQIAGGSSAALRTRSSNSFVIGDYVALVAELEKLTERIDASFLTRAADAFRIENEIDLAAAEAIDVIADLFTRAETWNRPQDTQAMIDQLEQIDLNQQPTTNNQQPAVWSGDVMRFRGRTFAHLFAVRTQEGTIPQRRNEDPLLPDSDRRALEIREIGNGRDEERLLFALVRAGARNVRFSYAASDGFGKPLRKSTFLRGIGPRPSALGPWVSEGRGPRAEGRQVQLLQRAGTRSVFDGYLSSEIVREHARRVLQSIAPTQLEDFGECPQKFLIKHLLGARDLEDPEREVQINRRDKGILDHKILERFYRAIPPEEMESALEMLPRLDQLVDEEFDALEERAPAANTNMRAIERRATKRILREFVAADLEDLIANGLFPKQFEYRFGAKHRVPPDHPDPFILETRGVPLRVEGTIDRIDAGIGKFRIIDYKSGKAGRHKDLSEKIDRGVRLQLALYAMAVAEFFGAEPAVVSGAIKPIAGSDADLRKYSFSLADHHARLRETLGIFVDAILRGAFPAFPNWSDEEFNSCKYCPVNHSCRTKHDAEERRAVLRYGEPRTLLEEPS